MERAGACSSLNLKSNHKHALMIAHSRLEASPMRNTMVLHRGSGGLSEVEYYADYLRNSCEQMGIPNEFWPHHGNLSKEVREDAEEALKKTDRPATAICTSTLELGIDIGPVKSVVQVGPPPSVASLRQRLGRSVRRKGEPMILRGYCIEEESNNPGISELPCENLLTTIAMVRLLADGWYEPIRSNRLHASTLVQQILSTISQYGGVNAAKLWNVLCAKGPLAP
jgi:ATP-dependent Lhr-like helicase